MASLYGLNPAQSPLNQSYQGNEAINQGLLNWWGGMNNLQRAGFAPVVGDIAGLLGDIQMYIEKPEERGLLNYGLSAAGLLPFVPAGLGMVKKAGDLPMDKVSRLQRAKEIGFDTDKVWYHGSVKDGYVTDTNITEFDKSKIGDRWSSDDKGFFFTGDPEEAGYYAKSILRRGDEGGVIYPAHLKMERPLVINDDYVTRQWDMRGPSNEGNVSFWDNHQKEILNDFHKGNYDSIIVDDGSYQMPVIFEPENIRSINAAFDPAKKDSANILASGILAAPILGLLGYQQDETY